MSYYRQIDGIRYDRALIEAAERAVAGRGDGRISKADAEGLLALVVDGGRITAAERATVAHLRENMTWTDAADQWFQAQLRAWEDAAPAPVAADAEAETVVVVLLRLSDAAVARHFSASDVAQAPDGAVVVISQKQRRWMDVLWEHTAAHKVADLPDAVESALCSGATATIHANVWWFVRKLGADGNMLHYATGFTNVSADVIRQTLETLGLRVIEGSGLRGQ